MNREAKVHRMKTLRLLKSSRFVKESIRISGVLENKGPNPISPLKARLAKLHGSSVKRRRWSEARL